MAYEEETYQQLRKGGVDHLLARYVASLFMKDPILVLGNKVDSKDVDDNYHFENILTTNWQSMRLKPAEYNSENGWRVEFRPCESQLTDFENAAIACFITLFTRTMLTYDLNFLIPISKVSENVITFITIYNIFFFCFLGR